MVDNSESSSGSEQRCPLTGCRAPDMANGHWRPFLQRKDAQVLALTPGLDNQGRHSLLTDWAIGRDALTLGLELRFGFFDHLPHRLMGLASLDAVEGSAAASRCLHLWDTAADHTMQHPEASRFLQQGSPFRALVEKMAAGESLSTLPLLRREVVAWRMAPVTERSIEAKHAVAKKRLAHNSRPSASSVSLSLRCRELNECMQSEDSKAFMDTLAQLFSESRSLPQW